MAKYYVFDDEQTAIDAEAYICQVAGVPIVGRNAKTGKLEPNKAKTERWAIPQQRLDGKWVFPQVPDAVSAKFPPEVATAFNTNFPNVKEDFDSSWFPAPELEE
jgi:hypothetical protein